MLSTLILLVLAAPSTLAQVNGYLQNRDPGDPPRVDLNQLQEQAFVMGSGEAYRDLLTIGASQAVADFAVRHERAEKYTIAQNRLNSVHSASQDTKFFSKTLSQPKGRLDFDKFHFPDSRRIRISPELAAERVLADRDEVVIVTEGERRDTVEAAAANGRLRALPAPASAPKRLDNYASVLSSGATYSHNINFGSPPVAGPARYVRLPHPHRPIPPHPVAPVSVAPLSIQPQSPSPLDYGYGLNHGKAGGSFASYTHG